MAIDYKQTVGSYLREILKQRGLLDLSQKELWSHLGLKKSRELYRKIIFEDHHTSDYSVYEEIAKVLAIDEDTLFFLAATNLAPRKIRSRLEGIIHNYHKLDTNIYTFEEWTQESLANHITTLYIAEGFSVEINKRISTVSVPFSFIRNDRLSNEIHRIWILPHTTSALPKSRLLKAALEDIKTLKTSSEGTPGSQYKILVLGGNKIPNLSDFPSDVELLTPAEFDSHYFSAPKYLESLLDWYKTVESEFFIDLNCKYIRGFSTSQWESPSLATQIFSSWLKSDSPILIVKGGFGTGKSTLLRHFATKLAESHINGTSILFPFLINLKDYKGVGWGDIVKTTVPRFMIDKLGFSSAHKNWKSLIEHGPFIIFLDALDEFSTGFTSTDSEDCIEQIRLLTGERKGNLPNPKIILSVREEMFPNDTDMFHFFENISDKSWMMNPLPLEELDINNLLTGLLNGENSSKPNNKKQSIERICTILGEGQVEEKSRKTGLSRPLIVRIVADNWSDLSNLGKVTPINIHRTVVESWLRREREKERLALESIVHNGKRNWLYWLAEYLEINESISLNFNEFPVQLCKELGRDSPEELDSFLEHEVRISSFLERDSDGNYYFPFRSFAQYCYAEAISQQVILSVRNRFGAHSLSQQSDFLTIDFIKEISEPRKQEWINTLFKWLYESRNCNYHKMEVVFTGHPVSENCRYGRLGNDKYTSANALFLLAILQNGNLAGIDLSGIYLGDTELNEFSRLEKIDLSNVNFSGSLITRAKWSKVNLIGAKLSWAWIHNCSWNEIELDTSIQISPIILTGNNKGEVFDKIKEDLGGDIEKITKETIEKIRPDGMFCLPGQNYKVGTSLNTDISAENSIPELNIEIDPIFIDIALVTNKDFQIFLEKSDKKIWSKRWNELAITRRETNVPYYLNSWDTEDAQPKGEGSDSPFDSSVLYISFPAAFDYATSHCGRLPTEFEYEAAISFTEVNLENVKEKIKATKSLSDLIKKGSATTPKEGFETLFREWCLDFFSWDHLHHQKDCINPFTKDATALLEHHKIANDKSQFSLYSTSQCRVLRGFRTNQITQPYFRESMEPTNVNPDVGFRVVKEVWIVIKEYLEKEKTI